MKMEDQKDSIIKKTLNTIQENQVGDYCYFKQSSYLYCGSKPEVKVNLDKDYIVVYFDELMVIKEFPEFSYNKYDGIYKPCIDQFIDEGSDRIIPITKEEFKEKLSNLYFIKFLKEFNL